MEKMLSKDASRIQITNYTKAIILYLDWIVENKNYQVMFNYKEKLLNLRKNVLHEYEKVFFSRTEIYDFAYTTPNSENGVIAALIFEGVGSISTPRNSILTSIKYEHLKENKLLVNCLEIEMPQEVSYLFEKTYKQNELLDNQTALALNKSEYVIKGGKPNKKCGRRNGTKNYSNNYISIRIKTKDEHNNRIFSYNDKVINGNSLIKAGKMFYLSLIEQIQGSIEKEDYYAVLKKYGQDNASISTYEEIVKDYHEYKENGYCEDINIEQYYKIYRQIKEVSEEKRIYLESADKELGCLGEKYFYKYLIKEYGEDITLDETKNGVGYDFSVNLPSKKLMYEVKSTNTVDNHIEIKFNLTIKELIKAFNNKENYHIVIIYFNKLQPVTTYLISNPISKLKLDKQAKILIELKNEGICVPKDIQVTIQFTDKKQYKKNLNLQKLTID